MGCTHTLPLSVQWPFVRVLGVQEPASTVFSLFNGLTILTAYVWFRREAPMAYPYHPVLKLQMMVSPTWLYTGSSEG